VAASPPSTRAYWRIFSRAWSRTSWVISGIVLEDQGVGGRGIAVQVAGPAGGGGLDEGAHRRRVFGDQLVRRHRHGRVAGIALVGEQEHRRLEAAFLLDGVGLAGHIALLDHPLVGQEGGGVEGVFAHLVVGEAVLGLQPHPEGGDRGVGQQDRPALHVGQRVHAGVGVGDQHLRVLLHEGRDHLHRGLGGRQVQHDEAVGAHAHLDRAGGDELGHVHAGAALDDGHLQAALGVLAGRQGLVEAALLGLGAPVGGEADAGLAVGFLGRLGAARRRQKSEEGRRKRAPLHGRSTCLGAQT
jgi:hypothetical protein